MHGINPSPTKSDSEEGEEAEEGHMELTSYVSRKKKNVQTNGFYVPKFCSLSPTSVFQAFDAYRTKMGGPKK